VLRDIDLAACCMWAVLGTAAILVVVVFFL
jgi:hypothetical protein